MHQTLKKLNTRLVALVLMAILLVTLIPAAAAAEDSGNCGNGVNWELSGGTLTISGTGNMYNYGETTSAPWAQYAESIRTVTVADGVSQIGAFAFFKLPNLVAVNLADSVKEIGKYAFYGCKELVVLDLGNGVQTIGESVFEQCVALKQVRLPNSLKTLRFHAFFRCESLLSIVIPASVTELEPTVFAYCTALRSAVVLADIEELPHWTFYGCDQLSSVSITGKITKVGAEAFHACTNLTSASYGGAGEQAEQILQQIQQQVEASGSELNSFVPGMEPRPETGSSSVTTEEITGGTSTVDRSHTTNDSSSVHTQVTTNQTNGGTSASVEVDAVVEQPEGWETLEQAYQDALKKLPSGTKDDKPQVNVYLKGEPIVSGGDLNRFAGTNVHMMIHTSQGAVVHINGKDLSGEELEDSYNLSFTLRPLTEKTDAQSAAIGMADGFTVVFHSLLNFKVEVELPLGEQYVLDKATFFSPEKKNTYERMQSVVVDRKGLAHFYLAYVTKDTEYLIGVNVGPVDDATDYRDAIIPDTLQDMFSYAEQMLPVEYVITGRKSSWGMNASQVTWILVGVLGASVIAVGVVMFSLNKRKLKNGYIPDTDGEDIE